MTDEKQSPAGPLAEAPRRVFAIVPPVLGGAAWLLLFMRALTENNALHQGGYILSAFTILFIAFLIGGLIEP